jgi:peptidoglycan/LPS O-acetylase OafA/YrhL
VEPSIARLYPIGSTPQSTRLHFLDVLRGIAALAVVLFHFYSVAVSPIHKELASSLPAIVDWICEHLYLGVETFFVLSGFVIAFSMNADTHHLRYALNFILRRSLRLDPLYWTTMAMMLAFYLWQAPAKWHDFYLLYGGWKGLAANMFYLQNLSLYPAASVLDVAWTLCLEVQFYLAYLLVLVAGHYLGVLTKRRGKTVKQVFVVLASSSVGVWSLVNWMRRPGNDFDHRAWMFFLGVALYFVVFGDVALRAALARLLVFAGLLGFAAWFIYRRDPEGIATLITATAIFTLGITGRLSTFFACRPLFFAGKISYSIYLVHLVVGGNLLAILTKWTAGSPARAWCAWALAITSTLLSATLLHYLIEAPSNRLSQRLKPGKRTVSFAAAISDAAPVPEPANLAR